MSVNAVNSDGSLLRVAGGTLYADAPIGAIQAYGGTTAPSGWLLCQGQAVSRTTYAELFAIIGTVYGEGDSSTTFNIPDLREATTKGTGLSGKSDNHYSENGVTLGEFIEDRLQSHTHGIRNGFDGADPDSAERGDGRHGYSAKSNDASGRTGNTTEVKAVGVNYIIKAKQVAMPTDFKDAIDDILSEFAKPIPLQPANNSTITNDRSRIVGGIVTVNASIIVPSGNHLVKENAVANISGYGTDGLGYVLPCLYRNTGNGTEEPSFALITPNGNLFPYYTKTEYNEIRINASYSSLH